MLNLFLKIRSFSYFIKIITYYIWQFIVPLILRGFVKEPFSSGSLAINSAVPIGCGQRQLVLGDRGRGKSSLCFEIIISSLLATSIRLGMNTHSITLNIACIYVGVGKRRTELLKIQIQFNKIDIEFFNWTIIISGSAADIAPVQWLAPYTGVCIGELLILSGIDVCIIFNDLTRHANIYRQISLLLRRPPAREAYPGDIFYLHARLLERCAHINELLGGGSCTGFPIVETIEGEVSGYIPTNIISITDGQLLLDSKLFNRGLFPAVNIGLSVSRIGSAAQLLAIKEVAGSLRLDLAVYRDLERNRQFKDQLDEANREILNEGDFLTVFFQQPKNLPVNLGVSICILNFTKDGDFTCKFFNQEEEKLFNDRIRLFKIKLHRIIFFIEVQLTGSIIRIQLSIISSLIGLIKNYPQEGSEFFTWTITGILPVLEDEYLSN